MDTPMQIPATAPDGGPWNDAALHALGATLILTGTDGEITVTPDIDLSKYDAVMAQAMSAERQAAFAKAMEYGNGITAQVVGTYSDVEARTWPLQRAQADTVLGGTTLPPDALLIKLAARRGVALEAFATIVQHKAQQFEAIADVGQGLRLAAEGLLDPTLDTPAKLAAALGALRAQTLKAAATLGLTV